MRGGGERGKRVEGWERRGLERRGRGGEEGDIFPEGLRCQNILYPTTDIISGDRTKHKDIMEDG